MAAEGLSAFRTSQRRFAGFVLGIAVLGVLAGVLLLRHPIHRLQIRACFHDVNGLRAGAFVRVAGVEVGMVRAVRAQPTNSACPANVEMELATDYPLSLPNDAVASVSQALLGSPSVSVDASGASGPPVVNGGQIHSQEAIPFTAASLERTLNKFAKDLKDLNDKLEQQNNGALRPRSPGSRGNSSPKTHPN
jgi:ABC-type transporter Mla subunit MlaD